MVTQAVLTSLGDPIRRRIVRRLSGDALTVNEIVAGFEISRPAISRHLRILRESGVVTERRSGRERIYRIEPAALKEAAAWLMSVAADRSTPIGQGDSAEDLERREPPVERPVEWPAGQAAEQSGGRSRPPSAPSGPGWRQW